MSKNVTRVDGRGQDSLDAVAGFGPGPESSSSRVRPGGGEDDIDGRGSFEARELERELRRMRRGELQVNFGLSFSVVNCDLCRIF